MNNSSLRLAPLRGAAFTGIVCLAVTVAAYRGTGDRPYPQTGTPCSEDTSGRTTWLPVGARDPDVEVQYCVARMGTTGAVPDSGGEVVWFSLLGKGQEVKTVAYSFVIRTSQGRVLRQGPARIRVEPSKRHTCRLEICEFVTRPGEKVLSVGFKQEVRGRRNEAGVN
jgi:hypothetical protein